MKIRQMINITKPTSNHHLTNIKTTQNRRKPSMRNSVKNGRASLFTIMQKPLRLSLVQMFRCSVVSNKRVKVKVNVKVKAAQLPKISLPDTFYKSSTLFQLACHKCKSTARLLVSSASINNALCKLEPCSKTKTDTIVLLVTTQGPCGAHLCQIWIKILLSECSLSVINSQPCVSNVDIKRIADLEHF